MAMKDAWTKHWWLSRRLRERVFDRAGGRCEIRGPNCTGAAEEVDHIVPRALGGPNFDPDNLRAACKACNRGRRVRWRPLSEAGPSREW